MKEGFYIQYKIKTFNDNLVVGYNGNHKGLSFKEFLKFIILNFTSGDIGKLEFSISEKFFLDFLVTSKSEQIKLYKRNESSWLLKMLRKDNTFFKS